MITVNFAAVRRREKTETTKIYKSNNNKKNSEVAIAVVSTLLHIYEYCLKICFATVKNINRE